MIQHEEHYLKYIERQGVGANDEVASSLKSYISYLNSVSRLLGEDISPVLLHSKEDIERIVNQLQGAPAEKTIRNYASAMRQYVLMVHEDGLWPGSSSSDDRNRSVSQQNTHDTPRREHRAKPSADLFSADLTDIERHEKVRLDDNSIPVLAALRANELLTDDDWIRIKGFLRDALTFLTGPDKPAQELDDGTIVVCPDADPRSADWPKIATATKLAGHELPSWAALWLWWLRTDSSHQFWRDVGSIAHELAGPGGE